MSLTLVVMAAGIGRRFGGPKQLEPIGPNGETFSDYSVYDALRAGFGKAIFIVNPLITGEFRERVGRRIERFCEVAYVEQRLEDLPPGFSVPPGRKKPWGTAHAVLACKDVIDSPFCVVNADDFYGRRAFEAVAEFLESSGGDAGILELCVVGYRVENTLSEHGPVTRGVCQVDERGFLVRIQECRGVQRVDGTIGYRDAEGRLVEIPPGTLVSMNMWGFPPGIFGELEERFPKFLRAHASDIEEAEFLLPEVVHELIQEGKARVRVLSTEERWFGITHRGDLRSARAAIAELIRRGEYPERLWDGGPR